jgi:hypothetical protein
MTISSAIPVDAHNKMLNTSLEVEDPEMFALVQHEKWRQFSCLELIASEVRLNYLNIFTLTCLLELYFSSCNGG